MAFSAMSTFWQLNTHIPNFFSSITIIPSVSNVTNTYATYTYYNTDQGKTYAIIVVTNGIVTVTPINGSLSFGYLSVGSGGDGGGIAFHHGFRDGGGRKKMMRTHRRTRRGGVPLLGGWVGD